MRPRTLVLTEAERATLEQVRDTGPRAYLREKAAALLKVADGTPAFTVARIGLLKPRHPETILEWLNDYENTRTLRPHKARRKRLSPPERGAGTDAAPSAAKSRSVGSAA